MHKVADAIIVLGGWRRVVVAVIAGAISALALPPWFAFPVLWLSVPVLVWLIDGAALANNGRPVCRVMLAAIVGWSFGFGYFLAGLWWIGAAFLVEAEKFAWLMPFAVLALPAALSLFWALGAALACLFWPRGWPRILIFAVAFSAAEWLRGYVLTGFPWNAFGYALTPTPMMMQSASVVGLWGLTLAAFVVFAAPAVLAGPDRDSWHSRLTFLAFAASILAIHFVFGLVRLSVEADTQFTDIRLRIVQPAIAQDEKWAEGNETAIFRRQVELSETLASTDGGGPDVFTMVLWPESTLPFYLSDRPDALVTLGELLPDGTTLLLGAARYESPEAGDQDRIFNSILAIGAVGEILDAYDKVHLVPFGEYLPFQATVEAIGLTQLTGLPGGFAAGTERRTRALGDVPPFAPLICYEIIFPGAVIEPGFRPDWLLNITNDAWFGDTPGPRQHFHQARLRAVEEGLPLVRAANTGISAIVDANGRIVASLGVGQAGVVDGYLPLKQPPTTFSIYGGWIFFAGLLLFVFVAVAGHSAPDRTRG